MTRQRKAVRLIIAALLGTGVALAWYFFFLGWIRWGPVLPAWANVAISAFALAVLSLTPAVVKSLIRRARDD